MKRDYRHIAGTSLIEMLIYIAIITIVAVGFVLVIYSVFGVADRARHGIELADTKLFFEQKMMWVLQGVDTISIPAGGSSGAVLTLTKFNFDENPIRIDSPDGVARLTSGATTTPITPASITVVGLNFSHIVSGTHERIRVTAELDGRFATTGIDQTIVIK